MPGSTKSPGGSFPSAEALKGEGLNKRLVVFHSPGTGLEWPKSRRPVPHQGDTGLKCNVCTIYRAFLGLTLRTSDWL